MSSIAIYNEIVHNNQKFKYSIATFKEKMTLLYTLNTSDKDQTKLLKEFIYKIEEKCDIGGRILVIFKDELEDPSEFPQCFLGNAVGYSIPQVDKDGKEFKLVFKVLREDNPLIGYW